MRTAIEVSSVMRMRGLLESPEAWGWGPGEPTPEVSAPPPDLRRERRGTGGCIGP